MHIQGRSSVFSSGLVSTNPCIAREACSSLTQLKRGNLVNSAAPHNSLHFKATGTRSPSSLGRKGEVLGASQEVFRDQLNTGAVGTQLICPEVAAGRIGGAVQISHVVFGGYQAVAFI
jgi:hypothetical protein